MATTLRSTHRRRRGSLIRAHLVNAPGLWLLPLTMVLMLVFPVRSLAEDPGPADWGPRAVGFLYPTCKHTTTVAIDDHTITLVRTVRLRTTYKCIIKEHQMEWGLRFNTKTGYIYQLRVVSDTSPIQSGQLLNKLDKLKAKLGLGLGS